MKRNGLLPLMFKWGGLLALLLLGLAPTVRAEASPLLPFSSGGHVLGFGDDGFYLSNGSYLFQTTFVGARAVTPQSDAPAAPDSQANGIGADGAPPLSQVAYPNLWPGISLHYDGGGGLVRSTYTIAAGANPADIRLQYNVPVQINSDGSLSLAFGTGSLTESAPVAWQEIGERQLPVPVAFQVDHTGREVGFTLGNYDQDYPLLIDPTLTWNTFLGGGGSDVGNGIALDGSGGVFVTGSSSADWGSPVRPYTALQDAFVARLDATTGTLTWNTFLGGAGVADQSYGIAVNGSGSVFVAGRSSATWGTPVLPHNGGNDIFVARLDAATGVLTWHSFLGGTGGDFGLGIAVDGSSVFVSGYSDATWGSPVRPYTFGDDAFAARLDASTGTLTWHTFLGGTGNEEGNSIALDGSGNVFVAGFSNATWGSPVRPYAAGFDVFAAQLNASTGTLTWHTFLGGSSNDRGRGIAVDGSGNIFVVGLSLATWGSPVRPYVAGQDAFVARLDVATGSLTWHTFLGGTGNDQGVGIAADGSGSILVTGISNATWGSPVRPYIASTDTFVSRLDVATGALTWNSFLGGTASDQGLGIAVDGSGSTFVVGVSNDTWGSPVRPYTIGQDAFVARVPQPCINSAATGPWNSGATWEGGVVPPTTEGACVLNGHTVTLDISPQIQQLLVETGGTLVMPVGFGLTAENFVNSEGTMAQTLAVNNANVPFLEIRNIAGTVVKYRGVNVNTTNNLGDVTARVREIGDGEFCTTDPLSPPYARRCYEITATNNLPANVRLWSLTTDLNGIVLANLSVFRFVGGWTELVTNRTTGTDGGGYSYAEGDSPGFSDFLLGDTADAPTAVTLQTFFSQTQTPLVAIAFMLVMLISMAGWVLLRRAKRHA